MSPCGAVLCFQVLIQSMILVGLFSLSLTGGQQRRLIYKYLVIIYGYKLVDEASWLVKYHVNDKTKKKN